MHNILSYCGLVDPRISASEKDLPVLWHQIRFCENDYFSIREQNAYSYDSSDLKRNHKNEHDQDYSSLLKTYGISQTAKIFLKKLNILDTGKSLSEALL